MIEIHNLKKTFNGGAKIAVDNVSLTVKPGTVVGVIGVNGAGKSTLLRLMTGVYAPSSGEVLADGKNVYKETAARECIAFVPDEPYFPAHATVESMGRMYAADRKTFNSDRYRELCGQFGLDVKTAIHSMSKGQKQQVAILLALSLMPHYLVVDEAFDGLDAIKRDLIKRIVFDEMMARNMTTVVASHSLREIGDFCDRLVVMKDGKLMEESELQDIGKDLLKVQIPSFDEALTTAIQQSFSVLSIHAVGATTTMVVRGTEEEIRQATAVQDSETLDLQPLSLEEIFFYRIEATK